MPIDANEAAVRRVYDSLNRRDLAGLAALVAADYAYNGRAVGRAAFLEGLAASLAAFPDARVTIEELLVAGDRVVARWTFRGTHRGTWLGIPATGRAIAFAGIEIARVADGTLAESWQAEDLLGALRQLGGAPGSA